MSCYRYSAERERFKTKKKDQESTTTAGSTLNTDCSEVIQANTHDTDTRNRRNSLTMELIKQKQFLDTGDDSKRLLTSAMSTTEENECDSTPNTPRRAHSDDSTSQDDIRLGLSYTPQPIETNIETAPPKKSRLLPWWCIYIGYFLALWVVGVAFWLTVEVAGVFGLEKSKKWLTSFTVAIVESIFLSQPIKVQC